MIQEKRNISGTTDAIYKCDTSYERQYFSLSHAVIEMKIESWFLKTKFKYQFFHFYFLTQDFSFNIIVPPIKLYRHVYNIHMEGTMSRILYLGPRVYFMSKRGDFGEYFKLIFYI